MEDKRIWIFSIAIIISLTLIFSTIHFIDNKKIEKLQKENIQWCKDYNQMANLTEIMIRVYINSSFTYSTNYTNCENIYHGTKRN
jgi:uncharacterized membrane protein